MSGPVAPDSEEASPTEAQDLTVQILSAIDTALNDLGISAMVSPKCCREIAEFFLRDINRISEQQQESISLSKYHGYMGFWIRKLKPVSLAFPNSNQAGAIASPSEGVDDVDWDKEITDVNERIALRVVLNQIMNADSDESLDPVRRSCKVSCDKVSCVKLFSSEYFNAKGGQNMDYLIHSMRRRTFGPHHMAMLCEFIIFSSCDGRRDLLADSE